MKNKINKKNQTRPKAPFIRSFGFFAFSSVLVLILIYMLTLPKYNKKSDFIGAILAIIFFGGISSLGIIEGIKKRRW